MKNIEKLLRQGCTDSMIKKMLRPEVRLIFNPDDFEDIKQYRRAVEKESYNMISAARKRIKEKDKKVIEKIIKDVEKKPEPVKEKGYYSYVIIGGRKIKIKVDM